MKLMTREFTSREKVLLIVLSLILVALLYYKFVDQPIRRDLEAATSEAETKSVELQLVESKLAVMRRMSNEMEDITAGGTASVMGSYNNSKEEMAILNDVLENTLQYSINFADVTRDKDQIRRNFSLVFIVDSYEAMENIVKQLSESKCRCLVGDLQCTQGLKTNIESGYFTVSATATFFETMVGGTEDAGLPAES